MTDDRPPPQTMTQAVGQVATGVVDSLKSNPVLLMLVLFNAAFVAAVFWTAADTRERQSEMVKHLLANQAIAQEMLSRCVVPPRTDVVIPEVPPA